MDPALVTRAYALLARLNGERRTPDEARAEARAFAGAHVTVFSREEQADGHHHHDLLVRQGGEAVYLGQAPAGGLPWTLRGMQRWDRDTLLRVNGVTMSVDQALGCLEGWFEDAAVRRRLIDVCLMQEALAEDPVELTPDERDDALESFRRGHGLLTAVATERWMADRGLTLAMLERRAVDQAVVARLRDRVAGGSDEAFAVWLEERRRRAVVEWSWGRGT